MYISEDFINEVLVAARRRPVVKIAVDKQRRIKVTNLRDQQRELERKQRQTSLDQRKKFDDTRRNRGRDWPGSPDAATLKQKQQSKLQTQRVNIDKTKEQIRDTNRRAIT